MHSAFSTTGGSAGDRGTESVKGGLSNGSAGLDEGLSSEAWAGLCAEEQALASWLRRGAEHEHAKVRQAVTENEATPQEVLRGLAEDESEGVRRAAKSNPAFPASAPEE